MDEASDSARVAEGQPVTAVLAGCALLVVVAIATPWLVPQQPLVVLLAGGVAIGVLAWIVGLVATVRHAAMAWKLGSLAILLVAGAAAALVAHGQYQTRARADASSFADASFGPNGDLVFPAGAAARGPISRAYLAAAQAERGEEGEFGKALRDFGLGNLNSPYLLQQDPRAIANCAAIDGLRALAAKHAAQREAGGATVAAAIAGSPLSEQAKRGIAAMVGDTATRSATAEAQRAMLDASRDLCALLARRTWTNLGGHFGFANAADRARYAMLVEAQRGIAATMGAQARVLRAKREEGQAQVRAALERSIFLP